MNKHISKVDVNRNLAHAMAAKFSFSLFLKERNKVLQDSAGHLLYSLTRGDGEQVEAIKTNEDQLGTHGGRDETLTVS